MSGSRDDHLLSKSVHTHPSYYERELSESKMNMTPGRVMGNRDEAQDQHDCIDAEADPGVALE